MSLIAFPQKWGTQDWIFVFNERKTNSAGRWLPLLKFQEKPLANKTKASGSRNLPTLPYPSISPRDTSSCKAVPFHLPPGFILSSIGFVFKHLFMISFSVFPFPCTSMTVWPFCPPPSPLPPLPPTPLYEHKQVSPLDVVYAVALCSRSILAPGQR